MMTGSEDTGIRKFKLGDIGRAMGTTIVAIVKGQFIMRLKIDKYFINIAFTFLLFLAFILFSLMVDSTLSKVERNKKELQELEILYTQKRYELITINRRSTVARFLEEQGSNVKEPEKPANILK